MFPWKRNVMPGGITSVCCKHDDTKVREWTNNFCVVMMEDGTPSQLTLDHVQRQQNVSRQTNKKLLANCISQNVIPPQRWNLLFFPLIYYAATAANEKLLKIAGWSWKFPSDTWINKTLNLSTESECQKFLERRASFLPSFGVAKSAKSWVPNN